MNILIICSSLELGGAERHIALLAASLRAREFGITMIVLKHDGPLAQELREDGVPVNLVAMRSRFDVRAIRRVFRAVGPRPDIVLSQTVNAQVLGQVLASRFRVPHVTIEHGGVGLGMTLHRRALLRLVAGRVDLVVAVSPSQVEGLVGAGYCRGTIRVIPNGVPSSSPSHPSSQVRADLGLAEDDFVALLVASLRPEKRVSSFVDAVSRASELDPRIRGVVAGGGEDLEALRARADAAGGAVVLLGQRRDVADLVAASDLVCLTSRTEGLPVTVLEAMALGRPVLAPSVGGIPDAVVDGLNGTLVAPGDDDAFMRALGELARAPERVDAMGEAALARYERLFTVDHMADAYAAVLSQLGGTPS